MTIPEPVTGGSAESVADEGVQVVEGFLLRTPKARRVAAATVAVVGFLLGGVAQTVATLAGHHLIAPDPLWLQIVWQWFGYVAGIGGITWFGNVK